MRKNWVERLIAIIALVVFFYAVSFAEESGEAEAYRQEATQEPMKGCEALEESVIVEYVEEAVSEIDEFTLGETQTGEEEQAGENEQAILAPPEAEYMDEEESLEDVDVDYAVAAPATGVAINAANFPDVNFRAYVRRFDTNSDGWLSAVECAAVMEIEIHYDWDDKTNTDFRSLNGIENFPNLVHLDCSYCYDLTKLDLSSNTMLQYLDCAEIYGLETLDLSSNTMLQYLNCSNCGLKALDLSSNTKLQYIKLQDNEMARLDVSALSDLIELDCSNTYEDYEFGDTLMQALIVGSLPKLQKLDCSYNALTSLDVTGCPELLELYCGGNKIRTLNVTQNKKLQVLHCGYSETLMENGGNELTSLDVSQCTRLTKLYCADNKLTELNLRANRKLISLECGANKLTSIDVSMLTGLTYLQCGGNKLTNLDVSMLTELSYLDCAYNSLTNLDVRNCTRLEVLECDNNKLHTLDVSRNVKLTSLSCYNNGLQTLDISRNTKLMSLSCSNNPLDKLDISRCSELIWLVNNHTSRFEEEGDITYMYSSVDDENATEDDDPIYNWYYLHFPESTALIINGVVVDGENNLYPKLTLSKVKSNGSATLSIGDLRQITPDFAGYSGWTVKSYKSSKPKVASIDGSGLLTARAEGTTKITVTTTNKKTATITVKVVDPYKPTGVRITQGKSTTLNLGQTLRLGATLSPSTAQSALTWKSSKPKVASVDGNGLVTPKAEGTTKITVTTRNKKKATITIKVVDPYKPSGVRITQGKSATLSIGQTLRLGAVLSPSTAQSALTWKSSKPKVASVNSSGLVTPLKEGTTKITVTTRNKKKATITVKVVDPYKPTGVRITQGKSATLTVGDTLELGAVLSPSTAQSGLTWKSSKSKVAKVSSNGLVTAVGKGTATITVTTRNGKKATCKVTVKGKSVPNGSIEIFGYRIQFPLSLSVGGLWRESINIKSDWTFTGDYFYEGEDAEWGKVSGRFGNVRLYDDNILSFDVFSINRNHFSLEKGDTCLLYLPGVKSNKLPESKGLDPYDEIYKELGDISDVYVLYDLTSGYILAENNW